MSEYKDLEVGQRVKVNNNYGLYQGSGMGTVAMIDPPSTSWPIEVQMDEPREWGLSTAPFNPEELDIV